MGVLAFSFGVLGDSFVYSAQKQTEPTSDSIESGGDSLQLLARILEVFTSFDSQFFVGA